ncbi:Folate-sensitive fragile site protein Fra10Ac1 protein [Dioscorea alata]|uniref:Folate-sensitive fragile site protein Fra10Ac1 protein n=1 Tax=Dioscorea alata TaxID=55571 RepID=A0ACB7UXE9_DIOAL|nr:Folate-sensitive fragile site protein Fra10Ac1 protein [Dioscorea alata]
MASLGSLKSAIFDKEERKLQYQSHIRGLNAYDRHKKFINDYVRFYGNSKNTHENLPIKTDQDTIRENYRFIVNEEDDMDSTWEKRLVKRYYDKLFKEYCIADMSHYKKGKIGLRWRTEKEVVSGKGQFVCGNKHCDEKDGLGSYEKSLSIRGRKKRRDQKHKQKTRRKGREKEQGMMKARKMDTAAILIKGKRGKKPHLQQPAKRGGTKKTLMSFLRECFYNLTCCVPLTVISHVSSVFSCKLLS